jgi:hypothetical protein
MPVVADQKPTTGTRAIVAGVGVRVGVGVPVGFGDGVGARVGVEEAAVVGCDTDVGDGCVGAQDITMTASVTAPNHRRAIRDARIAQA